LALEKAQGYLLEIVAITPNDKLVVITPEILNQSSSQNYGYKKSTGETESQKLAARAEFVKRWLCDDWDGSKDYSKTTLETCFAIFNGRTRQDTAQERQALIELLGVILQR
jgi:hypothetical protein